MIVGYVFGHDNEGVMMEKAANDGSEFHCNFVRYYTLCASLRKNFFMNEES
jgi:hypothetical protein